MTENRVVEVENNKEFVPPTGINDSSNNLLIGLGLVSSMMIMFMFVMKMYKCRVLKNDK